jgi:hypothetical protein
LRRINRIVVTTTRALWQLKDARVAHFEAANPGRQLPDLRIASPRRILVLLLTRLVRGRRSSDVNRVSPVDAVRESV